MPDVEGDRLVTAVGFDEGTNGPDGSVLLLVAIALRGADLHVALRKREAAQLVDLAVLDLEHERRRRSRGHPVADRGFERAATPGHRLDVYRIDGRVVGEGVRRGGPRIIESAADLPPKP